MLQGRFGQEEGAAAIEVYKSVPVVERLFLQRQVDGERHVVDEDVDLAPFCCGGVGERVRTGRRSDVRFYSLWVCGSSVSFL